QRVPPRPRLRAPRRARRDAAERARVGGGGDARGGRTAGVRLRRFREGAAPAAARARARAHAVAALRRPRRPGPAPRPPGGPPRDLGTVVAEMEQVREQAAEAGARRLEGRALTGLASAVLGRDGNPAESVSLARAALATLPEDDFEGRANALRQLASAAWWT